MTPDPLKCIRSPAEPCIVTDECGICPQRIVIEHNLWKLAIDDPEVTVSVTLTLFTDEDLIKDYFNGNTKAINTMLGHLMKATRGRVDPQDLMKELKETLEVYRGYMT
jgi:Asp-tRNA(Asn)/Glu-tRNA(Gln) amidotransferase B subunit